MIISRIAGQSKYYSKEEEKDDCIYGLHQADRRFNGAILFVMLCFRNFIMRTFQIIRPAKRRASACD